MTERTPPADRIRPPTVADERTMLDAWLDFHRRTLTWKCEGLSDSQLRAQPVPPSNLSLIGLVRHMADVERGWFAEHFGTDDTPIYWTEEEPEAAFEGVDSADVASDLRIFAQEVSLYRKQAKDFELDNIETSPDGREFSLRWIYVHMIEEYARHNGHADLLRQALDGVTGA